MTAARYDVGIEQVPAESRFELAGNGADIGAVLRAAELPVPKAAKIIARRGDVRVASVGPRRWLVCAPLSAAPDMLTALSEAMPLKSSAMLADVSGSTVTFLLRGTDVAEVLEQGISHDLSIASFPAEAILATEGWGVGLLLERDGEQVRITVDVALAAYVKNCLCSAAGQIADTLPGVMRAPPPAIVVLR